MFSTHNILWGENMKKDKEKFTGPVTDVSSEPTGGMPETAFEMINRYGTYEIQATSDTENMYPTIAQGYNKGIIKTDCENKESENRYEGKSNNNKNKGRA